MTGNRVLIILFNCILLIDAQSSKLKIKDKIFNNYNSSIAPESAQNRPAGLELELQVKSFYVERGYYASDGEIMKIKGLFLMTWTDERLQWEPSAFSAEDKIFIKKKDLWNPTFNMERTFDESEIKCTDNGCILRSNGKVTCNSFCTLPSACVDNLQRWPYGTVSCTLQLGVWNQINDDISISGFSTSVISDLKALNKNWHLLSISHELTESTTPLHDKTLTVILVSFVIERISTFYAISIVVPALVMLCCNLASLWVPINSNARYIILLVILHSHFTFIQQLSWKLPTYGESTPMLLNYYRDSMLLTAFLIIFITITGRLALRQTQTSQWIEITIRTTQSLSLVSMALPSIGDHQFDAYIETTADDTNLVQNDATDKPSQHNKQWKRFALIVERIGFYLLAVVYAMMLICFIPVGNDRPDNIVAPVVKPWK
ncbi:acetylcholine receptor subunit beta-like [Wyeomyia smithii]|uniref:acetylcholine receptor subunit beta-like n=1 Tax=Wyeomyia smithii TaxID=174621 RepID=UPI002467C3C9|nr:acetylcholine receptor subunit beta-like [Wyeomyia smithii]